MKKLVLLLWLGIALFVDKSYAVECKYCNSDFVHVKKHEWRCKVRIERDELSPSVERNANHPTSTASEVIRDEALRVNDPLVDNRQTDVPESDSSHDNCNHSYQCYCGRYFASLRGLNSHRRACFITEQPYLNDLLVISNNLADNEASVTVDNNELINTLPKVAIKHGLKLPKCKRDWDVANEYFKEHLDYSTPINNVDEVITCFNDMVYEYFRDKFGNVSEATNNSESKAKYENMSKNKLKSCLRKLKTSTNKTQDLIDEIKYVSRLLRSKLKPTGKNLEFDHNKEIKTNYWKYCKKIFEESEAVQPAFNEETCFKHFYNVTREKKPQRRFDFPSWLKTLNEPSRAFNLAAPTYKEVQKIISKMKSSGSPCPIDHLSVLVLKNCAILRTQVWRICCFCWEKKYFPRVWKNSTTILIHKKGPNADPGNFRPITLEPVLSKVMTSLIRNRMFSFVLENNFIECDIQKGFWTGLSGTVEHTELLTHIISNAKTKQKQLVVTLFDLKNAFGEVNHNLIRKVLDYHHIPLHVSDLITSLYTDYYISILTKEYQTNPINITRGVLQGDCLSPLIFNLCINTLIECIKVEQVKCLGYVYSHGVSPRHWFQFADDTAIVSALEEDNQLLCNAFSKWTTWADLSIRVDKCHTFGIKKSATSSVQYTPTILVNRERIPPLELGESFIYLGKQFNFGMKIDNIKEELKADNISYVTTIDRLPITSLNKISIIQQYVFSKYKWLFSIYDLSETWIVENLDNIIGKYVRKWFQLPVCANIDNLSFPTRKLGVNFKFAKIIYQKCKLSVRHILSQSKNSEIRNLYQITSSKNVRTDEIVNSVSNANPELNTKQIKAKIDQIFEKNAKGDAWNLFGELKEQNVIIKHIVSVCNAKVINMWQVLLGRLPNNIVCFIRKGLIFCLPNKSNLFRWKITTDNKCFMCQQTETQLHILSNCSKYLDRFKWRHDSILKTILNKLSRSPKDNVEIFADCEDVSYRCTSDIFENSRPDLAVIIDDKVVAIELTVCFDTNTEKSRLFKQNRYKNLRDELLIAHNEFEVIYLEVTTLGFISKNSYVPFNTLLRKLEINQDRCIIKCMETAIRGSYYIFCRRNKSWEVSELLNFY